MRSLLVALVVGVLGLPLAASAAPRVHLQVENVSAAEGLPLDLAAKATLALKGVLGEHTELAPAPGQGITSYALTSNVNLFERTVEPNPNGHGQVLVVKVGVQLVGAVLPSRAMALTGTGRSTVKAEVGATVSPRDEQFALDDALKDAYGRAVDQAMTQLAAPPKPAPAKPKKKAKPKKAT
jgi:hypothetical protein